MKRIVRSRDIVFHENQHIGTETSSKLREFSSYTLDPTPLHIATYNEEMQDQDPEAEEEAQSVKQGE